jgi:dihydroorotate dehydrogenase
MQARNEISGQDPNKPPVLVKLSPDIEYADLEPIVEQIISNSTDGIIVSNTTVRRNDLKSSHLGNETGGLSGSPLFAPSTRMLARIYTLTGGNIPLIGVGGIDSGKKAIAKINAGASLIQLYTGLVYKGPKLINNIKQAILTHITEHGFGNVSEAVGTRAREWEGK